MSFVAVDEKLRTWAGQSNRFAAGVMEDHRPVPGCFGSMICGQQCRDTGGTAVQWPCPTYLRALREVERIHTQLEQEARLIERERVSDLVGAALIRVLRGYDETNSVEVEDAFHAAEKALWAARSMEEAQAAVRQLDRAFHLQSSQTSPPVENAMEEAQAAVRQLDRQVWVQTPRRFDRLRRWVSDALASSGSSFGGGYE